MYLSVKNPIACAVLAVIVFAGQLNAQTKTLEPIVEQVQWGELLASNDLVWNRLPQGWKQAPFLGNGEQGKTKWVRVEAEVKGSVEVDPQLANGQWAASKGVSVTDDGNGIFTVQMSAGDSVLFWPTSDSQPKAVVTPVAPRGQPHHFGLNK